MGVFFPLPCVDVSVSPACDTDPRVACAFPASALPALTPGGEVKWGSRRGEDVNDERRRLTPGLFVFLVCFFVFIRSCYNTGGLAVRSDLAFSVESIDFCGIAPSLRSVW